MIVKNIRNDLAYKGIGPIVMLHNSIDYLPLDIRILYALVSNFEEGIDVEYIYELLDLKGWETDNLYENINELIDMKFIEEVKYKVNLDKIKIDFDEFKKLIGMI